MAENNSNREAADAKYRAQKADFMNKQDAATPNYSKDKASFLNSRGTKTGKGFSPSSKGLNRNPKNNGKDKDGGLGKKPFGNPLDKMNPLKKATTAASAIKDEMMGKENQADTDAPVPGQGSAKANSDPNVDIKVKFKTTIVIAGISAALLLLFLPFIIIASVFDGMSITYGSYNGEDNLYKLNQSSGSGTSSGSVALFDSFDNFLFIGDSRYDGASSKLSALGNNATVLGVSCSNPKNWVEITKNGSGTVKGCPSKNVTLPASVSGISLMLGVNNLAQTSEMQTVIENLHAKYPNAPIVINSVYHVGSGYKDANPANFNKKIDEYNKKMQDYSSGKDWVHYIDISSGLYDGNGYLKKELSSDNLHMNSKGNDILANNLKSNTMSLSTNASISDDNFVFWYQSDPRWGQKPFCGKKTISSAGCGGTAYAILVANLTGNRSFNPWDASQEGKGSGHCGKSSQHAGADVGLFTTTLVQKHPELKTHELSIDRAGANEALKVLQSGGMVVANVQKKSPFTGGGHWIVLRGLDANGKVKVANPNHRGEDSTYNIYDFVDDGWIYSGHPWAAVYRAR